MKKDFVWFLARLFFGCVFFYAGFLKLIQPVENFQAVIAEYQLIPHAFIPLIAATLPWCEFIFGGFMILGYLPRVSAFMLSSLCAGLVTLLGAKFVLTGHFPDNCGCFGNGPIQLTGLQVFCLDILNFLLGVRFLLMRDHPLSLDRWLKNLG